MRNKELQIRQDDFLNFLESDVNLSITELENNFLTALDLFLIDKKVIDYIIKNKEKGVLLSSGVFKFKNKEGG